MSDAETTPGQAFRIGSIGRHSLVYGVGMILTKAVSFVMLPIYTRFLTPADYGVLQLITMILEVVTIFAGSRIAWGIFHFYHKAQGVADKHSVLSTASLLLGVTYFGAAAVTIWAAPWIANVVFGEGGQYPTLVRIAAMNMAFQGLSVVPLAFLQLQDRSTSFVGVSLVQLAMQVALNLLFLIGFRLGVAGVLLGNMTTSAVIGVVLLVRMLSVVGVRVQEAAAKSFIRFGLPLVVMQMATFVSTFGDRYFLNRSGSTTDVGLYGLAYQFGFLVATIGFSPFQRVWDPQRFALARRPDRDEIFSSVFVYLNVGLMSVALGIALFAGDALRVMAAAPFWPAAVFVPVLAAAYVFQAWGNFLNLGIFITERTEYFTVANWVAAIVAVLGYVVLIPIWLAWGAAITTLASLAVRAWLAHVYSQRLWRVEYRWGPIVRLSVLTVLVGAVSVWLPATSFLLSVAIHTLLFLAYLILLWILPILTDEERVAIRSRVVAYLPGRAA